MSMRFFEFMLSVFMKHMTKQLSLSIDDLGFRPEAYRKDYVENNYF